MLFHLLYQSGYWALILSTIFGEFYKSSCSAYPVQMLVNLTLTCTIPQNVLTSSSSWPIKYSDSWLRNLKFSKTFSVVWFDHCPLFNFLLVSGQHLRRATISFLKKSYCMVVACIRAKMSTIFYRLSCFSNANHQFYSLLPLWILS